MSEDLRPSKTQRKKQMSALQDLGAELVTLSEEQLVAMALPERLHEAVVAAKRITKFEARRRQLQYIGKLMRAVDAEPIRERLEARSAAFREETMRLHRIERWRERLLTDENAFGEFISLHPHTDAQRLRVLVRNTQRERAANQPPRNYRALFHFVRDVLSGEKGDAATR